MASMKYDLPLPDYKTRFSLWQVKMRAVLVQSSDLDEALESFEKRKKDEWTAKEKKKLLQIFGSNWNRSESGSLLNHILVFKEIVADLVSMEASKGEALQLRGRSEQRTYNDNNDRDKSQNGRGLDWFSSYKSVQNGDVVRMGDDNPREIVGIGSVQIKTHDGMTRTLKDGNMKFCEHCVFGKHKRVKLNTSVHCTKGILDYVHADLWGPSRKLSLGGACYMLTSINDYSRKVWPYFLKHKDDTFAAFKEWKFMIEMQTEKELKVFGCTTYAYVDNGKLDPRAIKCLFLGYGSGVKGYKLWNPETNKTFMSRSVVFNESVMFNDSLSTYVIPGGSDEEQQYVSVQVEHVDDQETEIVDNDVHDTIQYSPSVLQPQDEPIAHHRTKRSCGALVRLIEECDMVYYAFSCAEQVENTLEPATYTEAVVSGDREKWISAMQEEMQSLEKNGTWELVHLPKQKKPVCCKWIFERKEGLSLSEPPRLIAAKSKEEITTFKKQLSSEFDMKDLGVAKKILGMEITRQKFCTDEDVEYISRVPYSSVVGFLMYAMVCSCPDLSYVMSLVSRYMANPCKEHWKAVQWFFRYLRGTADACLKFDRTDKGLVDYVDSDFAADLDKRRSLTGYVFTIGSCAMFHERTKYIDIKYHYVCDVVAQGVKDCFMLQEGISLKVEFVEL
uniref:Retrotransposon protein, putative, unclassified n=2 Tax=Oryza sativa subsp. japonica TaxID=39947 RepID=Q53N91_ORYSJ|nr:retrotransposon protein, putative, unclassified [Oryza sativa Japonica Group]ABA92387.1 retrotransposon protein, putative, unclassified [Oryza sativa Japonica Group]